MATSNNSIPQKFTRQDVIHAARTTVAAVVSLWVARLFKLPESYWAAITTLVVMQSTLGAAFTVSWQRFAGTAIGAAAGALFATYFGSNAAVFALGSSFSESFVRHGALIGPRTGSRGLRLRSPC